MSDRRVGSSLPLIRPQQKQNLLILEIYLISESIQIDETQHIVI
jgi:hypothetical protein